MLATPGMVIAANDRFRVVWEARPTGGSWPILLKNSKLHSPRIFA
jgi:hypothetical protein